MSEERLRAVMIGVGGYGANTLSALIASPRIELAAVADRDGAAAAAAGSEAGCPHYTDNRRALVEARPQAAFVAIPPAAAAEVIGLAIGHRLAVWTEAPLGADLAQAVGLCRQAEEAGCLLAVASGRRFTPAYRRMLDWAGRVAPVQLAEAECVFDWGGPLGWRGSTEAGGGALIQLGHEMIDLLRAVVGLPETVYCVAGRGEGGRPVGQAVYETEDTAVLLGRCAGEAIASLTVSRRFSPFREHLTLRGRGAVVARPDRCILLDADGGPLEAEADADAPSAVFTRQVEDFARAALAGADRHECSARESLLTAATIEAAYLSTRTGQPESPADLLANHDVSVAECLAPRSADRGS
jgi:predicted dehydrogenase